MRRRLSKVATENCDEKLRRKIATKSCCMSHNMKYTRKSWLKWLMTTAKVKNCDKVKNVKSAMKVCCMTNDFDVCVDKSFVTCITKTNDGDVLWNDVFCGDVLCNDVLTKKTWYFFDWKSYCSIFVLLTTSFSMLLTASFS